MGTGKIYILSCNDNMICDAKTHQKTNWGTYSNDTFYMEDDPSHYVFSSAPYYLKK